MRVLAPLVLACITAFSAGAASLDDAPEAMLLQSVDSLRAGNLQAGAHQLRDLLQKHPNFRLAQLLYGEVLSARSGVPGAGVDLAALGDNPQLHALRAEYRARVAAAEQDPIRGKIPAGILQLPDDAHHAVVVDLRRSRLYVLDRTADGLKVSRSYYASIGQAGFGKDKSGDLRTPIGIYRVTAWKPGRQLGAIYGVGALPLSYPNPWDRAHGRTGHGIWIHGVPFDTYTRAPLATEGCVALANADVQVLRPYFAGDADTPVILTDDLHWQKPGLNAGLRNSLEHTIDGWRRAWSARDTDAYLSYYADDFRAEGGMDLAAFAVYKQHVNTTKKHIDVKVRDLGLYEYPGINNVVLAQFIQDYQSDNFKQTSRKQQFWQHQPNGTWKIVFEASDAF